MSRIICGVIIQNQMIQYVSNQKRTIFYELSKFENKKNKIKYINTAKMNRQELVFALSNDGYFRIKKPSNDSSIVTANARNVRLNYTRCHEIYKGESVFKDPRQQEFHNRCKSMPCKSQMSKSQITEATSVQNRGKNFESNITKNNPVQRSNMTKSMNQGFPRPSLEIRREDGSMKKKYQFQEATKINIPENFQDFTKFNSLNLPRDSLEAKKVSNNTTIKNFNHIVSEKKMNRSIHLDEDESEKHPLTERKAHPKQTQVEVNPESAAKINSVAQKISYTSQKNSETTTELKNINNSGSKVIYENRNDRIQNWTQPRVIVRESLESKTRKNQGLYQHSPMISSFETISEKPEDQLNEIELLKKKLEEKEREIESYKLSLLNSENKNQKLEGMVKEMKSSHNHARSSSFSHSTPANSEVKREQTSKNVIRLKSSVRLNQNIDFGHEVKKELGGPIPALMYMTLFMFLLGKEFTGKEAVGNGK